MAAARCQGMPPRNAARAAGRGPVLGGIAPPGGLFYTYRMNFVLTAQMIDKIAFAMEDQKEKFAVDVESGEVVSVAALNAPAGEERYVRLPRWGPAEGFHLMESFVTSLDNPVYREQLSRALTMGHGVFRAFKDALKQNKEIEKLWFTYKEQRLRSVIISWYNANREARGLARLPEEPEETEELVASDFSFTWGTGTHGEELERLDRDAFFELFPNENPERLEQRFAEKRRGLPPAGGELSPILVAETPAAELGGFTWGVIEARSVHIVQLAITPPLRGIGLGEAMLKKFLAEMRARGMRRLTAELMGKSLRSAEFFQSMGFRTVTQVMECGLQELNY
jgi:GNAT superfamily N-acetyltransferase